MLIAYVDHQSGGTCPRPLSLAEGQPQSVRFKELGRTPSARRPRLTDTHLHTATVIPWLGHRCLGLGLSLTAASAPGGGLEGVPDRGRLRRN